KRYQLQDALTVLRGRHVFKMGFDVQKVRSRAIGLGDATGTFNFSGVLNFQNNVLSQYRQNFGTASDVVNTYWGVFFNDEMRLKPSLTLSLGLRYERETAVSDSDNFGPRIGVAWSPFKDGKGVIRAGTGIFYNRVLLRTVADSIQNTGGNLVEYNTNLIGTSPTDNRRTAVLTAIAAGFPNAFDSPEAIRAMLSSVCAAVVNPLAPCTTDIGFADSVTSTGNPLRTVEADLRIPESYQFNIGFERELIKGWVFEANYTINKTVHLWRDYNGNVPVLPAGYSDWTAYLVANDFLFTNANGTKRRYDFILGPSNSTGVGPCSFTANVTCTVNLNTTSTSAAVPLATSPGNNNNATGGPIGIALAAIAHFRPDPTVSETSVIGSMGNAYYQGLILELRSRLRKFGGSGFSASFRFAYTLSKTMDDGLNNTSNAEINRDFSREWARSLQDRRHRLAFSGVFDTPSWMGSLRFSPLLRYGSSATFNLGNGGNDRNLDDVSGDRINFTGDPSDVVWRSPGSPLPSDAYLAQFSLPTIGAAGGNMPRNAGIGPSFYTFDLNVTREWKFGERMRLRPNVQLDNILNAAVFNYGAGFIDFNALSSASSMAAKAAFLVPTRTYRQRQIRLGVRFDF
ncbi:MAG TPA: TonB-dependent receptor, partial [Pyrinomonadaceae bacterium]|nr:TonB-dependent receptor [Pyrinomonadaceae bacterium]